MSNNVPAGWIRVPLADVVDIVDYEREPINASQRDQRIKDKSKDELFPYYGATGQVGWIDDYRSEGPSVLLGEDGAPFLDPLRDKAYIVSGKYWVNNHAHILRGALGLVDNYFIYHQLNIIDFQPFVSGSTRLKLTSSAMKKIPLFIAPQNEQLRIVEKLEELLSDLDAGVAELKAAQQKLAQYRQSLLKSAVEGELTAKWRAKRAESNQPLETGPQLLERILKERRKRWEEKQLAKFEEQGKKPPRNWQAKYPEPVQPDTTDLPELPEGWVWASVDQVGEVWLGKMLDRAKHQEGTKLPYLRNVNVRWGFIESDDLLEMYFKDEELERYSLAAGDVLVCEGGEPGRAAVCGSEHELYKYQKALHRVRFFNLYEPELLVFYLEHVAKTGRLERFFTGSTIKHFTKQNLITMPIPLPSSEEQREIVATVRLSSESLLRQKEATDVALKQSEAQRKNILKSAFSGLLVEQDPNDEPASVLLDKIRLKREKQVKKQKPRKPRARKKESKSIMVKLIDVLKEANDWLPATQAFALCGVTDNTTTDFIEKLYEELRELDQQKVLEVRRIGNEDELKLVVAK